jgi:hypothetical protein
MPVAETVQRDHGRNEARMHCSLRDDSPVFRQQRLDGVRQQEHVFIELDDHSGGTVRR